MKQVVSMGLFVAFFFGVMGSSLLWAKNHVKISDIQVCTNNGKVKVVRAGRLQKELDKKGSCLLPSCDSREGRVFQKGDSYENIDIVLKRYLLCLSNHSAVIPANLPEAHP